MKTRHTIAIIGGGVSGTLTAFHLHRLSAPARIVIVEPKPQLGLGLAYSTTTMRHLLNVPAGKISAFPDQPGHFVEWLRSNYNETVSATDFIPRLVFGRYIQSLLAGITNIEHLPTSVVDCRIREEEAHLRLANGEHLRADAVVLALGNFDPAPLPGVSPATENSGAYCHSAWHDATYSGLDPHAPVVLIGTGLTAVDVLLKLRESGYQGTVTAMSRHGLLPERHAPYKPLAQCALEGPTPSTARGLLHSFHHALKSADPWRAVVDSIRDLTNEFWLALPITEQGRFRRHLQRRWEIVRHRMAPVVAARIDGELARGTLVRQKGSLLAVLPAPGGARVQIRAADGSVQELTASRVINCTGPDMNYQRVNSPLLQSLLDQGQIVPGPLGTGLWSDQDGALRSRDGSFSKVLHTIGPARLGTLLESIAVPELREQACQLATRLADSAEQVARESADRAA